MCVRAEGGVNRCGVGYGGRKGGGIYLEDICLSACLRLHGRNCRVFGSFFFFFSFFSYFV